MSIIAHKHIFLGIGVAVMVMAGAIVGVFGLNLGIDFTGGALTEVVYEEKPAKATLEQQLDTLELGGYSLRDTTEDDGRSGYILRTRDLTESERQTVESTMVETGVAGEVARFTSIGPVIGQELKDKAVWAIGGVALVIIIYVAIAFAGVSYPVGSWVYGGITIFALLHDVLVPAALASLLGVVAGYEVDVLFVMAILAVLGYSVNDTIVVFDRVRENLQAATKVTKAEKDPVKPPSEQPTDTYELTEPFSHIVDRSVTQTITRSINTSVTTLLALTALYFFGGETTQPFALILIAGVVAGTYSSIFLANPLLAYIAERKIAAATTPSPQDESVTKSES